jgi:hypothetical protein
MKSNVKLPSIYSHNRIVNNKKPVHNQQNLPPINNSANKSDQFAVKDERFANLMQTILPVFNKTEKFSWKKVQIKSK